MKHLVLKSDDVSPKLFQEAIDAIATSRKVKHVQMDIQVEPDHYTVCDMDWVKHMQQVEVTTQPKEVEKTFTVIALKKSDRMLRAGFGKHNNKWFVRVDLWFKAFRLAQV